MLPESDYDAGGSVTSLTCAAKVNGPNECVEMRTALKMHERSQWF